MTIDANLLMGLYVGIGIGAVVMSIIGFAFLVVIGKCIKLPW